MVYIFLTEFAGTFTVISIRYFTFNKINFQRLYFDP